MCIAGLASLLGGRALFIDSIGRLQAAQQIGKREAGRLWAECLPDSNIACADGELCKLGNPDARDIITGQAANLLDLDPARDNILISHRYEDIRIGAILERRRKLAIDRR